MQYCPNLPEILSPAEWLLPSVGVKISSMFRQYCRFYWVLNISKFVMSKVNVLITIDKIRLRMIEIIHGNCLCTSRRLVFEWKKSITYKITSNSNLITKTSP